MAARRILSLVTTKQSHACISKVNSRILRCFLRKVAPYNLDNSIWPLSPVRTDYLIAVICGGRGVPSFFPSWNVIPGSPWRLVSPARSILGTDEICFRRFQTIAETANQAVEAGESSKNCNPDTKPDSTDTAVSSIKSETTYKYAVQSNLKFSPRHDLLMIFTCRVCETRSTKSVCRESYEKGVVVARCDGCNNIHLIADRLGWFGEPGSVEDFLAARGEEVKKGCPETLCLTPEDLAGKKILEDIGEK